MLWYNFFNYNGVLWMCVSAPPHFAMKKYYCICKKLICIEAPGFPGDNPTQAQFEANEGKADINIECKICEPFPEMQGEFLGKSGDFVVCADGGTVYRAFPMGTAHGALTKYRPADTSASVTYFTARSFPVVADDRFMWSSVSLAQLMLAKNVFFLHSSFIGVGGKAVLFAAASGVGKSTQASLWQEHRSAEIINGDKSGILVENGVYACGVPFCGTSGICQNRILPLGAIVLLSQAKTNTAKRLTGVDALQGILQNVHLDWLAPGERLKCIDLIIELLSSVPVFALECTPDEEAVITLERLLKEEGVI